MKPKINPEYIFESPAPEVPVNGHVDEAAQAVMRDIQVGDKFERQIEKDISQSPEDLAAERRSVTMLSVLDNVYYDATLELQEASITETPDSSERPLTS